MDVLIELLASAFSWFLYNFLDPIFVSVLTLGFILLIAALHHANGLLDFGDGLMYQGSVEECGYSHFERALRSVFEMVVAIHAKSVDRLRRSKSIYRKSEELIKEA